MFILFAFLSFILTVILFITVFSPLEIIDYILIIPTYFLIFLVFALLYVFVLWIMSLFVNERKEYNKYSLFNEKVLVDICRNILLVCGIKVNINGKEKIPKDKRFLIVLNHKSAFDPIVACYALNKNHVGFISKPENFKLPILGKLAKKCLYMPIDRENDREALKTILKAIQVVKSDTASIGLYPEGTRNKTEETLLEFKTGGFKIAQKANVPIVIAVMTNTDKVGFKPLKRQEVNFDIIDVLNEDDLNGSTIEIGERVRNEMLDFINKKSKDLNKNNDKKI